MSVFQLPGLQQSFSSFGFSTYCIDIASVTFSAQLIFFFLKSEISPKVGDQPHLLSTLSFQRSSEESLVSRNGLPQWETRLCITWQGRLSHFLWEGVASHSPGHMTFPFSEPPEALPGLSLSSFAFFLPPNTSWVSMPDTEQDRVCVGAEGREGQLEESETELTLKQHTVYAGARLTNESSGAALPSGRHRRGESPIIQHYFFWCLFLSTYMLSLELVSPVCACSAFTSASGNGTLILHWRQLSGTDSKCHGLPCEKLGVWHKLDWASSLSQIRPLSGDARIGNGQSWFCPTATAMTLAVVPAAWVSGTPLGSSFCNNCINYHKSLPKYIFKNHNCLASVSAVCLWGTLRDTLLEVGTRSPGSSQWSINVP